MSNDSLVSSVHQPFCQAPVELFPDSINAPHHTHTTISHL